MLIKLVLGEEKINVIRAYTAQIGLENPLYKNFGRTWMNWFKGDCLSTLMFEATSDHKEQV